MWATASIIYFSDALRFAPSRAYTPGSVSTDMPKSSIVRGVVLGACVLAGCAASFAAGTKAGSLLQGTTRAVSVAPTAPSPQAVAHYTKR